MNGKQKTTTNVKQVHILTPREFMELQAAFVVFFIYFFFLMLIGACLVTVFYYGV